MIDIINLSKSVLNRLSLMGYEHQNRLSSEQLIFPMKIQSNGNKYIDRISEQELRLLFIEEFKKTYNNLFYSIETPTVYKHSFGKHNEPIKTDGIGQSASIDMCVFEQISEKYNRLLNIEFKSKNVTKKHIEKDIFKLISEQCNGVLIHLLHNTDKGTLCNLEDTGIFNKYYQCFTDHKGRWTNNKSIHVIVLSLKQKTLIHRELTTSDLYNLREIFFIESNYGNITSINSKGWKKEILA